LPPPAAAETFSLTGLLGGLGLLLLGMWLLTEGLSVAGGSGLRRILSRATRSRFHGLLAGFLITALLQSSGAVMVAVIGFVNAGVLELSRAIWLILGSNVGTSVTGWLVALVGFRVDVAAYALPLVGVGMLLRLTGPRAGRGALGLSLAGMAVFFFALGILKSTFSGSAESLPLHALAGQGFFSDILFLLAGIALTVLMQSSSAAIAVVLAAVDGGALGVEAAAAVTIGAAVGTTSTGVLAVLGATPNARRAAASHVLFNLGNGAVALVLLPLLLKASQAAVAGIVGREDPVLALALFHTLFKVLGVVLIWPFCPSMIRALRRRFRTAEEDLRRPQHLDDTVLAVPELAMKALILEMERQGQVARKAARDVLSTGDPDPGELGVRLAPIRDLGIAIGSFCSRLSRGSLPSGIAERIPQVIWISQNHIVLGELTWQIAGLRREMAAPGGGGDLPAAADYHQAAARLIERAGTAAPGFSLPECERALEDIEERYLHLKGELLAAGTEGALSIRRMELLMEEIHLARRACRQAVKAARRMVFLRRTRLGGAAPPPPEGE